MAFQRQSPQADQFPSSENQESLIAPGLIIEGKVEGTGHVRIAGRFKGEVSVKGDLTIERGAHISGEIRAENIVVRGEVKGNIHAVSRVELLEAGGAHRGPQGVLTDGSRWVAHDGRVEFG